MGVLIGEANAVTRFSYLEYQAIMVCLACIICLGLLIIELTMNRFQVLPLLFPGMFSIRERKFYFFDYLVENGAMAGRLRSQAKMLMRMTLCVVTSYLWQHCVMDTGQTVGTDFPTQECADNKDCFASNLHFITLLNRQHEPVDCQAPAHDFETRMVVSCIRFVQPSASKWLMHLAISHSITQLNLKAFEILVWIAGNSPRMRRLLGLMIFLSLAVCLGLFFAGLLSEFASSWLSFVTILSVPAFFHTVYQGAKVLEELWREESSRVQESIESHLNSALSDLAPTDSAEDPEAGLGDATNVRSLGSKSTRYRSFLKIRGSIPFPQMLTVRSRSNWSTAANTTSPSASADVLGQSENISEGKRAKGGAASRLEQLRPQALDGATSSPVAAQAQATAAAPEASATVEADGGAAGQLAAADRAGVAAERPPDGDEAPCI